MQTLDDLLQRSRDHRHLIAPGRSTSTREKPNRHLVVDRHMARVGHFVQPGPNRSDANSLVTSSIWPDWCTDTVGQSRADADAIPDSTQ